MRIIVLQHVVELEGSVSSGLFLTEKGVALLRGICVFKPDQLVEFYRRVGDRLAARGAHRTLHNGRRPLGCGDDLPGVILHHEPRVVGKAGYADVPVEEGADAVTQKQECHPSTGLKADLGDLVGVDGIVGEVLRTFLGDPLREQERHVTSVFVAARSHPRNDLGCGHHLRALVGNRYHGAGRDPRFGDAVAVLVDGKGVIPCDIRMQVDRRLRTRGELNAREYELLGDTGLARDNHAQVEVGVGLGGNFQLVVAGSDGGSQGEGAKVFRGLDKRDLVGVGDLAAFLAGAQAAGHLAGRVGEANPYRGRRGNHGYMAWPVGNLVGKRLLEGEQTRALDLFLEHGPEGAVQFHSLAGLAPQVVKAVVGVV